MFYCFTHIKSTNVDKNVMSSELESTQFIPFYDIQNLMIFFISILTQKNVILVKLAVLCKF